MRFFIFLALCVAEVEFDFEKVVSEEIKKSLQRLKKTDLESNECLISDKCERIGGKSLERLLYSSVCGVSSEGSNSKLSRKFKRNIIEFVDLIRRFIKIVSDMTSKPCLPEASTSLCRKSAKSIHTSEEAEVYEESHSTLKPEHIFEETSVGCNEPDCRKANVKKDEKRQTTSCRKPRGCEDSATCVESSNETFEEPKETSEENVCPIVYDLEQTTPIIENDKSLEDTFTETTFNELGNSVNNSEDNDSAFVAECYPKICDHEQETPNNEYKDSVETQSDALIIDTPILGKVIVTQPTTVKKEQEIIETNNEISEMKPKDLKQTENSVKEDDVELKSRRMDIADDENPFYEDETFFESLKSCLYETSLSLMPTNIKPTCNSGSRLTRKGAIRRKNTPSISVEKKNPLPKTNKKPGSKN